MLLTLPGLPCLFTGDEVGAEYQPYAQPGPIDWTDHAGVRDDTKKLIALRRTVAALHSGEWLPLNADPATPLFAYLRTSGAEARPVVVVLNFSASDLEATIDLPEAAVGMFESERLTDLWTSEDVPAMRGEALTTSVPAWAFRLVTRADA